MPYDLQFYSLPAIAAAQAPDDSAQMRDFIHAVGEKLGTMAFAPAEATLFLAAVEELTDTDPFFFLGGSIGETPSDLTHDFGRISHEDMEAMLPKLDRFIDETTPSSAGLVEACARFDLSAERFLTLLEEFRALILQAHKNGADLATLYSEESL